MVTDIQRRNQLLRRVGRISGDKLKKLEKFVSKLEKDSNCGNNVLSFAGTWKEIEDSAFDDLTVNLADRRLRNNRRIDG